MATTKEATGNTDENPKDIVDWAARTLRTTAPALQSSSVPTVVTPSGPIAVDIDVPIFLPIGALWTERVLTVERLLQRRNEIIAFIYSSIIH